MPLKLTRRVKKVLEILFEEPQLSALALRLEEEVSENIPLHHDSSPAGMDDASEQLRRCVVRLAKIQRPWQAPF